MRSGLDDKRGSICYAAFDNRHRNSSATCLATKTTGRMHAIERALSDPFEYTLCSNTSVGSDSSSLFQSKIRIHAASQVRTDLQHPAMRSGYRLEPDHTSPFRGRKTRDLFFQPGRGSIQSLFTDA